MFETTYSGPLILTGLAPGAKARLNRLPSQPETGWDTVRETWLIAPSGPQTPDAIAALHWRRGDRLGTELLWVADIQSRFVGGGFCEVDLLARGLLGTQGVKVSYTAAPAMTQGQNVSVSGYGEGEYDGFWPRVTALEPEVVINLSYLVETGRPPLDTVGKQQLPPAEHMPEVRASSWTSLADPTLHVPYGWVLMSRASEGVAGAGAGSVFFVTDTYQHVMALTP